MSKKKNKLLDSLDDDLSVFIKEKVSRTNQQSVCSFVKHGCNIYSRYKTEFSEILRNFSRMVMFNSESFDESGNTSIIVPGNITLSCNLDSITLDCGVIIKSIDIHNPGKTHFSDEFLSDILNTSSPLMTYLLESGIIDDELIDEIKYTIDALDEDIVQLFLSSEGTRIKVLNKFLENHEELPEIKKGIVRSAKILYSKENLLAMCFQNIEKPDGVLDLLYYEKRKCGVLILDRIYKSYGFEIDKTPIETV